MREQTRPWFFTSVALIAIGMIPVASFAQQSESALPAASAETAAAPPGEDRYAKMPPTEGLADVLSARGRYLLAIRTYEALPPTASIENKMGVACMHMLMFEKARSSFETALKLNPKSPEAYNNLGTLAHSQGDWGRAEKMYRKSLKINPQAANTWQNLGTLYYAKGKFKNGDMAYKKALEIDPNVLENSRNRGITTHAKAGGVSEIHYHLAMTYAQAGSKQLAMQYLRQAINEGFHDRARLLHEKDFADLRTSELFLKMVDDLKNN